MRCYCSILYTFYCVAFGNIVLVLHFLHCPLMHLKITELTRPFKTAFHYIVTKLYLNVHCIVFHHVIWIHQIRLWAERNDHWHPQRTCSSRASVTFVNYNSTFIIGTSDPCAGIYSNNERLSSSLKEYLSHKYKWCFSATGSLLFIYFLEVKL